MRIERVRTDRGAAAVEFALVAVLLVTLVMGVMEFGRLWAIQGSLAQASRDAARTAAITDSATQGTTKFGEVFWAIAPLDDDSLTGSTPGRVGTPGDEACRWTVDATYTTKTMTGFWPGDIPIRAQGAMRCNG